jgi:hypothetical protein
MCEELLATRLEDTPGNAPFPLAVPVLMMSYDTLAWPYSLTFPLAAQAGVNQGSATAIINTILFFCMQYSSYGTSDQVPHGRAFGFVGWDARKATTRMVIPFARSLTPQTAHKANALRGCDKIGCSLCCAPWHRRITTTGVARLAITPILSATRFMMDLIRGSSCFPRLTTVLPTRHGKSKSVGLIIRVHYAQRQNPRNSNCAGLPDSTVAIQRNFHTPIGGQ